MAESRKNFYERVNMLGSKQRRLARGYTMKVGRNGILVAEPKRAKRPYFPIQRAILLIAGFFALKGFMLAAHGEAAYEERLASLQNGTAVEAIGASIMGADPITQELARIMRPLIKR